METPSDSEDGFSEMPTRPMRVKVLYTFDHDSKVTCLARFTETLQVPVVQIEETAYVGVISLHKCLQSIVSASPELLSNQTNDDYAIYAFDYSEQDTPLVGQGMLSNALAASTATITGSMITGRVCQNVPAIFSNGVKETLEVKLRLMPIKSTRMEVKSAGTPKAATSAGFDPNAWNTSLHQLRPPQGVSDLFDFDIGTPEEEQVLMDQFLGMSADGGDQSLQDMGMVATPTESLYTPHPAFASHSHSAPGSRVGSPNLVSDHGTRRPALRHQSFSVNSAAPGELPRPTSRASVRSDYHTSLFPTHQQEQHSSSYEEYQDEDGQARKRARITQTDWRGKSSFGGRSADLRVTAATAASMQMHRPVATRPFAPGSNLEPPPRVPTPVPRSNARSNRPGRPSIGSKSLLRQASTLTSELMSDVEQMSDAIASSPEDGSPATSVDADGTPLDIPSSPPIYAGMLQNRSPRSMAFADSGYMSERIMGAAASESCSPEFQPQEVDRPFIKREESTMSELLTGFPTMSDANCETDLPGGYFGAQRTDHRHAYSQAPQSQMSSRANSPLPNIAPAQSRGARLNNNTARRSSLALPTIARPNMINENQRSRSQHFDSDAGSPAPSESGRPTGLRRSGSGAPRRKIIEQRLHSAVAKGEVPQFCSHCGAIETPTWRRLYVKYVDGKPSPLDRVEGEGETIGIEELEYDDETGDVTKFVIRKTMKKTKDLQPGKGFQDTQICNSCGLWFAKMRSMRPQQKWGRKSGTRRSRKDKLKAAGEMTDGLEPQSEAFYTDAIGPDDNTPPLEQTDSNTSKDSDVRQSVEAHQGRKDSDTSRYGATRAESALERMARSSPVKNDGTQESPIELDDRTPKPTRRLLFPSPRQDGVLKTLDSGDLPSSGSKQQTMGKTVPQGEADLSVFGAFAVNKENHPPIDADIVDMHPVTECGVFKTPQKGLRRSPRNIKLLESPLMTSPSSTRKRKADAMSRQPALKPSNNDFMTSPASSRYFLRSTPTRLAITPGRRSQHELRSGGGSHEVSPFSRQLADMLSNDTSLVFNTPSQAFAFSDLPNFTSPSGQNIDWENFDHMLGSDFPELDSN